MKSCCKNADCEAGRAGPFLRELNREAATPRTGATALTRRGREALAAGERSGQTCAGRPWRGRHSSFITSSEVVTLFPRRSFRIKYKRMISKERRSWF